MPKTLAEVFPNLKLTGDESGLFSDTEVLRVSTTRRKDFLHIYLASRRLIDKKDVHRLERRIKAQLFSDVDLTVRIFERFQLSLQYTPELFLENYRDSLYSELSTYHPVIYALVKAGEFRFPAENEVTLELEESIIAEDHAEEIVRILEKVFNERAGFSVQVTIDYVPKKKKTRGSAATRHLYGGTDTGAVADDEPEETENVITEDPEFPDEPQEPAAAPAPEPAEKVSEKAAGGSGGGYTGFSRGKKGRDGKLSRSSNPDVLMGRDFDDEAMPIRDIEGEGGETCVRGEIIRLDTRETKSEKILAIFDITDDTDTITGKLFFSPAQWEEIKGELKIGAFLKMKGIPLFDRFDHELGLASINAVKKIPPFREKRKDTAEVKRVELHCHSKMSEMDGVSEVGSLVKRACEWGMPGIAITDHGVVQALTEAGHAWDKLFEKAGDKRKEAGEPPLDRQDFFKVVLGVEAYLVDDLKLVVGNGKEQDLENSTFVVFDLETTGFSAARDRIIEIGAVKVRGGEITDRFSTFVDPQIPIPARIEDITHISDDMVRGAGTIDKILPEFLSFIEGAVLVGHNVAFDIGFINQNCRNLGYPADYTTIDTVGLSRHYYPLQKKHTLDAVAKTLGVSLDGHHRAVNDAECTAGIFLKFLAMLQKENARTVTDVADMTRPGVEAIRSLHPHHAIILAKNTVGRSNLYRLISKSHVEYFRKHPLIPKSEVEKHREGLILGSACCLGELYEALVEDRSEEEISRIVRYYDYLEVQPIGNNRFMIADERRYENITSEEDIRDINRRVLELGRTFRKPVVATCDVHFLDPEDEIYRTIIMSGKAMDSEEPAPLFLRTTDEMLDEFSYLDPETAREIVIENPRRILAMCDSISPVRPDKCAPVIENSDETLRRICYDKAHEIYGEELPPVVAERLERELNSIISNGFAVMYIIAQKLVWKSVEDGYLVGSRGSVGSSFVAFTAGITEVNSLQPHYVCPKCHYSDFDSEEVRSYGGNSGCDMPDKVCPVCGEKLNKDGFDIPFETFLGFNGDKEPDIDLNFSGEYQSKAHKYTEVIFGYGQTFRAGTISGLADKNAYGYVKNFYEERGLPKRKCEINRQLQKLIGIKTNTGQHPGGIIVLPRGEEIDTFTPVQHPANKMDVPIITTHYDYHSIDHNLLKLDILGHDDPTMVRYLQDQTGIDPTKVPLDDPEVMKLFASTEPLGIRPEDISGTKLGCLGLPEFGTDFAMQMVVEAKPTTFSHLVRISGLSHGTDVWSGNAQTLIQEGKATIDTAICTRDDIMIYLIQKGIDQSLSFKIMESVRKGKGLKPEMEEAMRAAEVPDWYIWSCKKIKYMFPKAHAAAYVMMCWRIAWFKVHRPQEFYAAWFSIRSKHFDYEHMCRGRKVLEETMAHYRALGDAMSSPQKNELYDMRMVQEMYARGIEFLPLDIFRAKARHFTVVDGMVMPAINSINGMGEQAADAIEEAVKDGPFLSKDDFRDRTKCSATLVETLSRLGILGEIPESNQISLFDLL
ncbi:MAG: PolC-type DNA polymerase III [Lachnospiraceae bacterium]|nr:PolC-type DNA polymerase III [Lachnospiraceae bacterium]